MNETTPAPPTRRRLPLERRSVTHHFQVGEVDGYMRIGLYDNGEPGELFLDLTRQDSTLCGFASAFSIAVSMMLQYGVPLEHMVQKFSRMYFEPDGRTRNPEIPYARSIVDYVFEWMRRRFLKEHGKTSSTNS